MTQAEVLTHVTHVNGWDPAVNMSYMLRVSRLHELLESKLLFFFSLIKLIRSKFSFLFALVSGFIVWDVF